MNERIWFTCHACGRLTNAMVTATTEEAIYTVTCAECGASEAIKMVSKDMYHRVRRMHANA